MSPTENFGPLAEQIRAEAADWFARMRRPDAEASRPAFEKWYATPTHKHAYEQLVGRWEQSGFIGASHVGRERHLSRAPFAARHPAWSAAAALVVLLGGGGLFLIGHRVRTPVDRSGIAVARYESGAAVRDVALSDGSHVTLDKASLVLVSYSPISRTLTLARGRARFRAVHDSHRAFEVRAGPGQVSADGTVFDVALRGQAALINAVEGSVSVRSRMSDTPARLVLASQQILVPVRAELPRPKAAAPDAGDWLSHMIMLDHTSLGDAAAQVGQDAPHKILFVDDASALQITGSFESGDIEGLASAAQAMFALKRMHDSTGNILLARSPKTAQK